MFIDEDTKVKIEADLNTSVIHGTLKVGDLVPVFLKVLRHTPEYVQIIMSNNEELRVLFDPYSDPDDDRWCSEYMSYFLNEELFDVLNNYAPSGYYFGALDGDGSDFGYWLSGHIIDRVDTEEQAKRRVEDLEAGHLNRVYDYYEVGKEFLIVLEND